MNNAHEVPRAAPRPIAATVRTRYFATPAQAALTLLVALVLGWGAWRLLEWGVLSATFLAEDRAGCAPGGACWAFVVQRIDQFLYGFYPAGERWRPTLVLLLPIAVFLVVGTWTGPRAAQVAGAVVLSVPILSLGLLWGGFLNLSYVPAEQWGGLTLTVVIATTSFVASMPLAVLLALGRRSTMPVIGALATAFIELWRGLPLVGILFMAVILLPLVLPPGVQVGRIETAMTALTIYSAAYLAEVVRGGLQAIPVGQMRAASALGFGYWRTQTYIALPQALGKVLPGIVNSAIALFKDTSYVMIVGLFDFISIVTAALSDPKWLGSPIEAYVFVAAVYWAVCFGLSRVGSRIEARSASARGLART